MTKDKKLFKIVFTLNSGKSVVYTLANENAFKVFEDWKKFREGDNSIPSIIEISKLKEGQISEKLGIDLGKVDAIQIEDPSEIKGLKD